MIKEMCFEEEDEERRIKAGKQHLTAAHPFCFSPIEVG